MQNFIIGVIVGICLHHLWIWWKHRVTFTTTSYTTNTGKTHYVSYAMPKLNFKNVNVWPFRKAEDVFVGKKRRKK
jgi:hypothetical protein